MKVCPKCQGSGRVQDDTLLGAQMKAKRNGANLTLREVAKSMGYSISYVSDLEHGRKPWTNQLMANFENAVKRHI